MKRDRNMALSTKLSAGAIAQSEVRLVLLVATRMHLNRKYDNSAAFMMKNTIQHKGQSREVGSEMSSLKMKCHDQEYKGLTKDFVDWCQ